MNEIEQYEKLLAPIQDAARQFHRLHEQLRDQLAPAQEELNRTLGPVLREMRTLGAQMQPYLETYRALASQMLTPVAEGASAALEYLRAHEVEVRRVLEHATALSEASTATFTAYASPSPFLAGEPSVSSEEFNNLRFELRLNEAGGQARLAKLEAEVAQLRKLLSRKPGPGGSTPPEDPLPN